MQEELTRRGFLKGAVAVTATTLAGSALAGCTEAAEGAQTGGGGARQPTRLNGTMKPTL
jgi:hypothetical protein